MRRRGHYADRGVEMYAGAQMQDMTGKLVQHNYGNFEENLEAFTPEREQPYVNAEVEAQWKWANDRSRMQNPVAPLVFSEGQAGHSSGPNYPGHRPDPKLTPDKQNSSNSGFQHHDGDQDPYKESPLSRTFEGLQQKFHDEIMKLTKEQIEAEDAENTRHREKINAINTQHHEQLAAVRAQHAARRNEFLSRESHDRQQQYHQIIMDNYANNRMPASSPHVYSGVGTATSEAARRNYNANANDVGIYRERARFLGNSGDQNVGDTGAYSDRHAYGAGSSYY